MSQNFNSSMVHNHAESYWESKSYKFSELQISLHLKECWLFVNSEARSDGLKLTLEIWARNE